MRLTFEHMLPGEDRIGPEPAPVDLDRLYRVQHRTLSRFVARRSAPEDVPDIVQESFGRLARRIEEDRPPPACPGSWLTRIAANLMIDRRRRAAYRGVHEPLEEAAVAGTDPVAGLEARDEIARVDAALLELPKTTRDIFLLHRLGGHSYADIAHARGLSVKQVEKQIAKVLVHLRRRVRPDA